MEIIVLSVFFTICYTIFEPNLDISSDKVILWYNEGFGRKNKKRVYKILFEK